MKGLDYPSERYVRLYSRDTVSWAALGWEAQALYPQILRRVDRAGVLDLGDELLADALVAIFPAWPAQLLERASERLLKKGYLERNDEHNWLFVPEFEEAETAKMTSAQRSREHRARKAAGDKLQRIVADGDATSQNGTRGDAAGRGGTRGDSVPSQPFPSLPVPTEPDCSELAADGDSKPVEVVIWIPVIRGKKKPPKSIPVASGHAGVTVEKAQEYGKAYELGAEQVASELRKAKQWCIANPTRRKTPAGIDRFLSSWLERSTNGSRGSRPRGHRPQTPYEVARQAGGHDDVPDGFVFGDDLPGAGP